MFSCQQSIVKPTIHCLAGATSRGGLLDMEYHEVSLTGPNKEVGIGEVECCQLRGLIGD